MAKVSKQPITTKERQEIKQRFGNPGVTFAHDKDGIYCHTQRERSNSYPSVAKIPKSKVKFVESTG